MTRDQQILRLRDTWSEGEIFWEDQHRQTLMRKELSRMHRLNKESIETLEIRHGIRPKMPVTSSDPEHPTKSYYNRIDFK